MAAAVGRMVWIRGLYGNLQYLAVSHKVASNLLLFWLVFFVKQILFTKKYSQFNLTFIQK